MPNTIQRATDADAAAVSACVHAAYAKYVERIGRRPAPMDANYVVLIAHGEVFVTPGPTGIVALIVALMTENIAFYTRLGYEAVEHRVEDGFARVFMRKSLR